MRARLDCSVLPTSILPTSDTQLPPSPLPTDNEVAPTRQTAPIRAFNITAFWGRWGAPTQSFIDARLLGANMVHLVPYWMQSSPETTEIDAPSGVTPTDDQLRATIAQAKDAGLEVALKPHIDIIGGQWRGYIGPPAGADGQQWIAAWCQSYRARLLPLADLAQQEGVRQLVVGTELERVQEFAQECWLPLIAELRQHFSGSLTYAANWTSYSKVTFWSRLDLMGIDAYFPLTTSDQASQAELDQGWRRLADDLESFSRAQKKLVLLTEIGYENRNGTAITPWSRSESELLDENEQAMAYRAALTVLWPRSWLVGLSWWSADLGAPFADARRRYFDPRLNRAAAELSSLWSGP